MRCSLNVLQERWKGGCWSAERYDDDDMSAKRSSSPHLHDLDDRQRMLVSCEVWCWHVSQVSSYPEPPGSRMFILLLHLRCLGWALLCHLCVKLPLPTYMHLFTWNPPSCTQKKTRLRTQLVTNTNERNQPNLAGRACAMENSKSDFHMWCCRLWITWV